MVFASDKKIILENYEENTIRRYLLGELAEDEQTRIEDAAFADADALALVQTTENDLIDEYVRGELNAADASRFERMFRTSPERLKRVEFARTFVHLNDQKTISNAAEAIAPPEKASFRQMLTAFFAKPQIAFGALALLILIVGAVFLLNLGKRPTDIAEQKNTNINATPTIANRTPEIISDQLPNNASPAPTNTPEKYTQNKSPNVQPTPPKPTPAPTVKTESPAPVFAALVFPAGMTRGGGKTLQLKLAPNVKFARLVFNLEKGDDIYKNYRIEITNKSNATVSQANVPRSGQTVVVTIPAAKLAAGKYEAVLSAVNDMQNNPLSYYDFEVKKP